MNARNKAPVPIPVGNFLSVGDGEFFPPMELPHLPGVTLAWDRNIDAPERRLRVTGPGGLLAIFWYRQIKLTESQRKTAAKHGDHHPPMIEEYRTEDGRTFKSLQLAIRDGLSF